MLCILEHNLSLHSSPLAQEYHSSWLEHVQCNITYGFIWPLVTGHCASDCVSVVPASSSTSLSGFQAMTQVSWICSEKYTIYFVWISKTVKWGNDLILYSYNTVNLSYKSSIYDYNQPYWSRNSYMGHKMIQVVTSFYINKSKNLWLYSFKYFNLYHKAFTAEDIGLLLIT